MDGIGIRGTDEGATEDDDGGAAAGIFQGNLQTLVNLFGKWRTLRTWCRRESNK